MNPNIIKQKPKEQKIDNYILLEKLGKGQFGIVFKAKDIRTNKFYAIKKIKKQNIQQYSILKTLLQTEVSIMHSINHPNIIHLYEYLESYNSYYLVMNYCNKGDFTNYLRLSKKKYLEEKKAVFFLKQIMNGFQELRKNKIFHRDFKLDNIFIHNEILIIGDFGLAKAGANLAETVIGTPLTMAYEILKEKGVYNSKADLWSVGIVYYRIIFGINPFSGFTNNDLIRDIDFKLDKGLVFDKKFNVSEDSKDLLRRLLVRDPIKRIDWKDFFNHKLFRRNFGDLGKSLNIDNEFEKNMCSNFVKDDVEFMNDRKIIEFGKNNNLLLPKNILDNNTTLNNSSKSEKDLIFEEILYRYNHEKNKILFMIFTVKNIQKEILNGFFLPMKSSLMNLSIFIIKKALIINDLNKFHLNQGNNIYYLNKKYFNEIKSTNNYKKILNIFSNSQNLERYFELLQERCRKMEISIENIYFLKINKPQLNKLDSYLDNWYSDLIKYTNATELNDFIKKEKYFRILFLVRFCIESEVKFEYLNKKLVRKFDWNHFLEEFRRMSLNNLSNQI